MGYGVIVIDDRQIGIEELIVSIYIKRAKEKQWRFHIFLFYWNRF